MRMQPLEPEQIKLNMTAMIDIVFQLLVFFIMTFKVVEMEGDFNVKMPLASLQEESMETEFPTVINIQLTAGTNGNINSITVDDDDTFSDADMYLKLTKLIESKLAGETDPEKSKETEVEFDISPELKYSFTVDAIGAVSGRVQSDGTVKKLVEKIKFKDKSN